MNNDRDYNKQKVHGIATADLNNVFVSLDSISWGAKKILSLQELSNLLSNRALQGSGNVINLQSNIKEIPENLEIKPAYIAIDNNYMYVWVNDKWKKIPMMDL